MEGAKMRKEPQSAKGVQATAKRFRKCLFCLFCLASPFSLFADIVHVYQRTLAGGVATQLSDQTLETGSSYSTTSAPAKSGYIFTHWSIDVNQPIGNRDRLGRAKEVAAYTLYEETTLTANYLPIGEDTDNDGIADGYEIYWYGSLVVSAEADTDNDGLTFAEELAAGTDPLMPDETIDGGVEWADGALHEMNLQVYEQARGALVGGNYTELFTSPIAGNAATSATFGNGGVVWPVVADLNDDGLWDLAVCWSGKGEGEGTKGTKETQGAQWTTPATQSLGSLSSLGSLEMRVFLNVGSKGNPEFVEDTSGALEARALTLADTNSVAKLAGLSLDVPAPADALSATVGDANQDGVADLLVSDSEGRVWYYRGTGNGERMTARWGQRALPATRCNIRFGAGAMQVSRRACAWRR